MVKQHYSIARVVDRTETHKQKILEFLLTGCSLTPWQAITYWRCTKLATRISELKAEGWVFQQEMITGKDGSQAMKYWL